MNKITNLKTISFNTVNGDIHKKINIWLDKKEYNKIIDIRIAGAYGNIVALILYEPNE